MNESLQPPHSDAASESLAAVRGLVARRSAPASPTWWTLLLVAAAGGGILLASMWATEPQPLPTRTHAAFACCLVIAASWTAFAAHALTRRRTLLANQRVVAASMGVAFSSLFAGLGVAVTLMQGEAQQALAVGLTGASFAVCAGILLRSALKQRRDLRDLQDALQSQQAGT